ncbi:MAG TPA: outer membrane protein assembly factor BamC [Burkholderiales bacterium]|nr:outer membrane protein assembly factor BamC [Burkholderiales bacterium]
MDKRAKVLLLSALVFAGCSILPDSKKVEYKSAGKLPPLEVPPDLTAPGTDERYTVPDINPQGTATYSAYSKDRAGAREPGSTELLPIQDEARIERAGSQRWLVVKGAPEAVWPTVKEFWKETGFLIKEEIPEAGVIETDWAENRANIPQDGVRRLLGKYLDRLYSTPERDKFRTRIERGAEEGTSEIYISHRGMYEIYTTETKDTTAWQPRPADPELEAEMLRRLMVRFGVEEARATSLLKGTEPSERATLVKNGKEPMSLSLDEGFDRAWRRVGLALDRVGFTVEDRDRSQGLYFVRYVDPEVDSYKKPDGILSKFIFWDNEPKKDKTKSHQYRILVKEEEDKSQVNVLSRDGGPAKSDAANKILGLLYSQLK